MTLLADIARTSQSVADEPARLREIPALVAEIRAVTGKPIVVYPNSGETWDAGRRCWSGSSDPKGFGALAVEWRRAGAQVVGGCCRTRPAHIREVAQIGRA